ncbi:anhydro-N-acetylmuramic acid kinase [Lactonifactor longoviformis]|uniref:Anhydro-N-acetylmuramic acid kinase n=1 Tax=Lactonifactor longoviformis DSM 17459 TaxID=1122155 RepID=A0A1M5A3H4_9CLOT|nr:anhydro-N-acetylmuramic acid kinase [Lactonifactor longoviformis]POP31792.1 anhydro-N-acetylmuramic acid kinase [Lactonifactor longoviformis]SHF24879.1 anhydro-N-acetylmuramic acid kinase [Lactonifactor longoviformis DSM 17459]
MDLIMGMNSGSSFDGIDVILAETKMDGDGFPAAPRFIKGSSYEWPLDVKKVVLDAFENKVDMVGLNRLNYVAGAVFAEKAVQFLKENGIESREIKVLGLDTQTIYQEQPDHKAIAAMTAEEKADWPGRWISGKYPAGYQVGDTSVIANLTNIDTVTHFRQADHTFGGSAAPLMQYLDFVLFRKEEKPKMTLNIGGIANLHLACSDRRKMYGFDVGPGNVISDYFAKRLYGKEYDRNGALAASGRVNEDMLNYFMHHPFFERPVPRSGWRMDYSPEYLNSTIAKFSHVAREDMMATACAFTGEAVAKSMEDNIPREVIEQVDQLYASGGGVKNPAILQEIQKRIPQNIKLVSSSEIGIPPEFKEAIKFATLAYSTIHCVPGNIPAAGHASQYAILGNIGLAPRNIKGGAEF